MTIIEVYDVIYLFLLIGKRKLYALLLRITQEPTIGVISEYLNLYHQNFTQIDEIMLS